MPRKPKEETVDNTEARVRTLELANAARDERDKHIDETLQRIERVLTNGLATQVHDLVEWMKTEKATQIESARDWKSLLLPTVRELGLVVAAVIITLILIHAPQLGMGTP